MDGTYPTDLFFNKATEWMDVQRQANTPFFVYLTNPPHGPFQEDSSDMPSEDYKKFLGTHPEMTVQIAKIFWEVENIDKRRRDDSPTRRMGHRRQHVVHLYWK